MLRLTTLALGAVLGLAAVPRTAPAPAPDASPAYAPPFAIVPPAPWSQGDPADSLYKLARERLNRGDNPRAAALFRELVDRYPKSTYAPDALYWQAFALYRQGGPDDLRRAQEVLQLQRERYPKAATIGDAEALNTRINGALARAGDADAAEAVTAEARAAVEAARAQVDASRAGADAARAAVEAARPEIDAAREAAKAGKGVRRGFEEDELPPQCAGQEEKAAMRIAALNALLQMDAEQAVPILKDVLKRRDACSLPLRRKAVFLLSQKHTDETADILLDLVRNDPDPGVREQAVFWLSQVHDPRALKAIQDVLATSTDRSIQEKAIFALSQYHTPESAAALRRYAEDPKAPDDLREKAIFWVGQTHDPANAEFLRQMFKRSSDAKAKERILFSLAQMHDADNNRFLVDVATDAAQPLNLRKSAIFWASQSGGLSAAEMGKLYDTNSDREVREQILFALGQRRDGIDKLLDIARNEKDASLRSKAIFWLGQSRDPRAAKVLQEIVNQ